ncbi:DALR anticodon-binding domain-containing protein [Mahella australiensis]|uniref:arginine--tRNA ligase n=1 Tax=Mahella australiensis (strain DSM 15567 / CIP 107919 / 50-1 BON) TaxID=697281 RepID=F3ZYY6_MAHA5|nr:DALR anticodon-binding domain-containing protein [Mahella australiensis]AEE96745.1 Arginine--tRNA ligase [Mahella australiensis 50-1 BON]
MADPIQYITEQIIAVLNRALTAARSDGSITCRNAYEVKVNKTRDIKYGDFYTNMPIEMVRLTARPSDYIARTLLEHADISGTYIDRMEIAGSGFINIFLKPKWFYDVLTLILKERDEYGRVDIGDNRKVLIGFPDIDMYSIVWGDCVANILETAGYEVLRECYVNSHKSMREINDEIVNLRLYGVVLSSWFYEQQLYDSDLQETIEELDIMGYVRHEGDDMWFTTDTHGALILKEGRFTNIAMRMAYYRRKIFKEGYDLIIEIGDRASADTFETVREAMICLGCELEHMEYLVSPDYSHLLENIGRDALRFLLSSSRDKEDDDSLFEVQYAYARICSILRHMDPNRLALMPPEEIDFSMLRHPAEQALMRCLPDLPHKVRLAAQCRQPAILTDYLVDVADLFHKFYDECRVRINNNDLMYARLGLLEAARVVLANGLYILNIDAPERLC